MIWPIDWASSERASIEKALAMAKGSFLTRDEVRDAYQKRAGLYDWAVLLYYLIGMRIGHWRQLAMEALRLRPGDTIVEIGCGTGLNFALLEQGVGAHGRIIGVDISEAMLKRARQRVDRAGWRNVELVCSSADEYRFPDRVDGVLSTGALTFDPAYDEVIERGAKSLASGRCWVVLDYKMPTGWLRHLAPLLAAISSPFGVSVSLMDRHPWESVQRHLRHTKMRELYGGFAYLISGEAS